MPWLLAGMGTLAGLIIVGIIFFAMRKSPRPAFPAVLPGPSLSPEGPSVNNWLDQAQSGRLTLEPVWEGSDRFDNASLDSGALDTAGGRDDGFGGRLSGNIFWKNGESNNGHGSPGPKGHGSSDKVGGNPLM